MVADAFANEMGMRDKPLPNLQVERQAGPDADAGLAPPVAAFLRGLTRPAEARR